jgi:alkaline phosphatase D
MDRRRFLGHSAFFTVAAAALSACGGGGDSPAPAPPPPPPPSGTYSFAQGVASGDPKSASVVFWTRCVRTDADPADIALTLQVSLDPSFQSMAAEVQLSASATHDFTVRAKVVNLPPATLVYYRFIAGTDVSTTGRAKTAPAANANVAQLNFAWFACQNWGFNHWGAMSLLVQEDLDFVVHVGDYVYEAVSGGTAEPAHAPIALPSGGSVATTLADYRLLYRTYRGDSRLQAIHAKFAMIATWDDHEFSSDAWADHQTSTIANLQETARRRAANQAWVEYMPVDFGDISFDAANTAYDNLRIYRDFRFGNLAHLVMTDERLYRDDHVVSETIGSETLGSRYLVPRELLLASEVAKTTSLGRAPSILGLTQTQWWKDTLAGSTATWKLWGNAVMLSRLWLDMRSSPPPDNLLYVLNCDSWDGYPSHKAELMDHLFSRAIDNVVALTGDLHAFQCGVVRGPDASSGAPVLVDFVTAGISSTSFYSYVKSSTSGTAFAPLLATGADFDALIEAHNPDFAYVDHDAQGYASAVLTAGSLVVTYTKVQPLNNDGTAPLVPLLERTRITLAAGSKVPSVADNI